MIELREYVDAQGHNHYRKWASKQDPSVRARVDKAVFRLGDGNLSSVKPEGEGVSALRLDFGPGYRVYFAQDGEQLVILLAGAPRGGSKRTLSWRGGSDPNTRSAKERNGDGTYTKLSRVGHGGTAG